MRIVHVITRFNQGGTASWLKTLIPEQENLGHEVFLLAGSVQKGEKEDSFFTDYNGIRIVHLGRKPNILRDLRALFELRKKIKKISPDVVNTHTSKAGIIGRIAAFSIWNKHIAVVQIGRAHV